MLSMLVGGTYVRTNASTTFSGKACGDLRSGETLTVAPTEDERAVGRIALRVHDRPVPAAWDVGRQQALVDDPPGPEGDDGLDQVRGRAHRRASVVPE